MYQIRLVERRTVMTTSEVANLDPEKFRNLSIPYEGDSEEDFLNYISSLYFEDVYDELRELDEDTLNEFLKLNDNISRTQFFDSSTKGSDEWYELGEYDIDHIKNGRFRTDFSTDSDY